MTYRSLIAVVLLVLAPAVAGCDRSDSGVPTAPTSAPSASPGPAPGPQPAPNSSTRVDGSVRDTAFRRIAGVTIEVLNGASAGMVTTSDATGGFWLTGTFDATTAFRASKAGYRDVTRSWARGAPPDRPHLSYALEVDGPSVDIAGDYTLTLLADSACVDLPSELRTRSYSARITATPVPGRVNTLFFMTLTGSQFLDDHNGLAIGVAGNYLAFYLYDGKYPGIVEQVAPTSYLAFSGSAGVSVNTSSVSSEPIVVSLDGWVEYCVANSAMRGEYGCAQTTAGRHCDSSNHRLILTRR